MAIKNKIKHTHKTTNKNKKDTRKTTKQKFTTLQIVHITKNNKTKIISEFSSVNCTYKKIEGDKNNI